MKLPIPIIPVEVGGAPFATKVEATPTDRLEASIQRRILMEYSYSLNAMIRSKYYWYFLRDVEEKMRIEDGDMDRLRDESRALFDHIETIRP